MDYKEEGTKIALAGLDTLIMTFTPDDAISLIDEMVHVAVNKNMTGEQKADWVLTQAKELVIDIWEWVLPRLIEILYQAMKAKLA